MGTCPDVIKILIDRFDHQLDQVRSLDYNETQLRIDFVNPLFDVLGWDMNNTAGYAEQYREVVHEDRVKVAGATKAPDYSFRIGGSRKFFLEAKKPAVDIKQNPEPAYQLRRYGWSAKLAVSLLTDFEELAIYDCRVIPKWGDKAAIARREFINYSHYADKWDFIAGTFSKDAILRGDFDRYCETKKGRGAQEFDEAFLEEIEEWRKQLASNLALRNESLDERSLNFAVQRIIDRIIFLRICEDRGIELNQLQPHLNGENVYARLKELFLSADHRYNSGLFHFKPEKGRNEAPDELTLSLQVDDATLKRIIRRLYYPESPYEFAVVSADILGSVYERFLGNVITLTAGHRARIEKKPEVRKAGGVYYTPTYIVDHVVQNTVGKLLEGTTPEEAVKLRIIDPACGSGSFLLAAYRYLLDWHLRWYVTDDADKWARGKNATIRPADRASVAAQLQRAEPPAPDVPLGHWALVINERKRILLNNIYGADIDYQAVEVTKLALLLGCLEGESAESVGASQTLFRARALPDLGKNILCGNSLIGTDVMSSDSWQQMSLDRRREVNPFDFSSAFGDILHNGGFDAVVGNPPWGQKDIAKDKALIAYIREKFPSSIGIFDLYRPFVELATKLIRSEGWVGQVLPDIILLKDYQKTRQLLLEHMTIARIDWWGMAFKSAVIDAVTIIAQLSPAGPGHRTQIAVHDQESPLFHELKQEEFSLNPRQTFNLFLTTEKRELLNGLSKFPRLGDLFEIHEGVHSGNMRPELFVTSAIDESCKPLIFGRTEIKPYILNWSGSFLRISAAHCRTIDHYCNLGRPEWHEQRKVLVRRTGDFVLAAIDEVGRYASNNFFLLFASKPYGIDLYGLCALLNSPTLSRIFQLVEPRRGRVFAELKIKHLTDFPLPLAGDKRIQVMNSLGRKRVELAKEMQSARLPEDADRLTREANAIDNQINQVVAAALGLQNTNFGETIKGETWQKETIRRGGEGA